MKEQEPRQLRLSREFEEFEDPTGFVVQDWGRKEPPGFIIDWFRELTERHEDIYGLIPGRMANPHWTKTRFGQIYYHPEDFSPFPHVLTEEEVFHRLPWLTGVFERITIKELTQRVKNEFRVEVTVKYPLDERDILGLLLPLSWKDMVVLTFPKGGEVLNTEVNLEGASWEEILKWEREEKEVWKRIQNRIGEIEVRVKTQ